MDDLRVNIRTTASHGAVHLQKFESRQPGLVIRDQSGLPLTTVDGRPLPFRETAQRRRQLIAKRAIDMVLGNHGLIAVAPLLLAIALAVRMTSPGPVMFRQEQSGCMSNRSRS